MRLSRNHLGLTPTYTRPMHARRVLFVCTHNSARSQMAEGLLRAWGAGRFEAYSAGTVATQLRPEAVTVMRELGIDIAAQQSKTLTGYLGRPWDLVVTVCDQAREACPMIPGAAATLHWSVDDPSSVDGDEAQRLAAFRAARDDLAGRIRELMRSA
jgi:arsenate reductase